MATISKLHISKAVIVIHCFHATDIPGTYDARMDVHGLFWQHIYTAAVVHTQWKTHVLNSLEGRVCILVNSIRYL